MSILDFFRRKSAVNPTPPVNMKLLPVTVNPTGQQLLLRHVGRLSRLYQCVERGDKRPSIAAEIERRKREIHAAGHEPPATEVEALALLKQLGG